MRKRLILFVALFLFWMVFFTVARTVFMAYNYPYTGQLNFIEILKSDVHGLKMDMSMTGYFLVIYGLILTASTLFVSRALLITAHGFTLLFLLVSSLIVMMDLELYRHWGFRMNTTPFFYMGSEAAGSVGPWVVIRMLLIACLLFASFCWLYFRFVAPRFNSLERSNAKSLIVLFLVTASMIMPIRGSFGTSTMNPSMVYYHPTKTFANHAGINVTWNFLYSLQTDNAIQYPEDYFDKKLTDQYFQELYPANDSTAKMLTTPRPNILLIILEGITAEVIEPLGGRPGIMPNLNALCKEGLFFDRFYANGDRTDKGLVSILSSYPPQPRGSIIKFPQKTQKLSFLSTALERLGYASSFVYGGDIDFANYNTFLTNGRFKHITSEDDFSEDLDNSKWGVADEFVFNQTLTELDTTTQPFFKAMLTLSSHEPFDVPMKTVIEGSDEPSIYMNSCYYADKSLGEFMQKAKQSAWWANTMIIITADHGHRLPGGKKTDAKEKYHIPMIWTGGVISKDSVVHTLGNQSDIANTLLGQIDKPSPEFIFSKDLFGNKTRDFAMYIFNDGYGYLDNDRYIVFDNPGKQYLRQEGVNQEDDLNYAKAYVQKLYSDYNSKK
jgi:phosphoglycerol transferase MdoB-like AlkP superfamily enzyme